jgi:methyltransferase (TIGR00027 family)
MSRNPAASNDSTPPLLQDISDTARWVAHYRALESERPRAILRDPFARRLAGERGRIIAETLPKLSLEWVIPVRARVYDELVLDEVRGGRFTTVLNLAAGFDTRPYRLELPDRLRWIEADLPGIIAAKAEALSSERPLCALERTAVDITQGEELGRLLSRLDAEGAPVLVVTEGLLAYLEETQVAALGKSLFASRAVQGWILEATLPEVLTQARRAWGHALRPAGAEMKFAPPEGLNFFGAFGWRPRVTRSLLEEAHRLGREMPMAWAARPVTILLRGRDVWRRMAMYGVMEKHSHSEASS